MRPIHFLQYLTPLLLIFPALASADITYVPMPSTGTISVINSINAFLNIFWPIAVAIVVAMFIFAGIKFLTAQGNPNQLDEARKAVIWGVVGVVVIILAYSVVLVISNILTTAPQNNQQGNNQQNNQNASNPGPGTGACLATANGCTITTAADCQTQQGTYGGDGTLCPTAGSGACCYDTPRNGGSYCADNTTQTQCEQSQPGYANGAGAPGTYMGDGTQCQDITCPAAAAIP